ncbi:aspartate dehydrogenase [Bacillus tianshenii]|nr:aspartate dehydrogenase [Bacillus tianshenii]
MLKVGLIGFGAIGQDVAHYINNNVAGDVILAGILVRNKDKYEKPNKECVVCDKEEDFFALGLDVVVESAGHQAVYEYGVKSLEAGCDFITVSVGAFSDADLLEEVEHAARASKKQLILPSAAIAGLDRIASSVFNEIDEIKLVTRKPIQAWRGTIAEEIVNLDEIQGKTLIYEGTARESAKMFPESTNVSAALSMAGIGFDETKVQVFADPTVRNNTHQIIAKGYFGEVKFDVQNTPSAANPKSGYIVAMSICKVLKNLTSPIVVGI